MRSLIELCAQPSTPGLAGSFLPHSLAHQIPQDLDGSGCRKFLEAHGYKVVSNRDTGRNGEAVTECGLVLSTNGYIYRRKATE
jgi:hypothetical protein